MLTKVSRGTCQLIPALCAERIVPSERWVKEIALPECLLSKSASLSSKGNNNDNDREFIEHFPRLKVLYNLKTRYNAQYPHTNQ